MADKRIDELEEATSITSNDLFVLEQAMTAKKLTGQTMTNFLLALANGHGGISSITKTGSAGTNPVVDTYTITFADTSTTTFQVTNGVKGNTGPQGVQGPKGDDITITATSVTYQAGASGVTPPTGTWTSSVPSVSQGGYLWTRVIINYSDGNGTTSYSVSRMGIDGNGAVSTVCNVSPDGTGNVALTASDVGALADSYTPPVTSVNTKTGTVVLTATDVGAVATVNSVSPDAYGNVAISLANLGTVTDFDSSTTYNDITLSAPSKNIIIVHCSNANYEGIGIVNVLANNTVSIFKNGGSNFNIVNTTGTTIRISHQYLGSILHIVY